VPENIERGKRGEWGLGSRKGIQSNGSEKKRFGKGYRGTKKAILGRVKGKMGKRLGYE